MAKTSLTYAVLTILLLVSTATVYGSTTAPAPTTAQEYIHRAGAHMEAERYREAIGDLIKAIGLLLAPEPPAPAESPVADVSVHIGNPGTAPDALWYPPRPRKAHPRQADIDRMRASLVSLAKERAALPKDEPPSPCGQVLPNICTVGKFIDYPDSEDWHQWGCMNEDGTSTGCNLMKDHMAVTGNTARYTGDTESAEYLHFVSLLRSHGEPITKLVINSGGGPTEVGKLLGLWVYENGIDVQVRELCFSSCANYIFTAGRNKYIEEDALVGWHGTPVLFDGTVDTPVSERLRSMERQLRKDIAGRNLPNPERELRDAVRRDTAEFTAENRFYAMIGVDPTVAQFSEAAVAAYEKEQGRPRNLSEHEKELNARADRIGEGIGVLGHTFSAENMAHFGIRNVTYLGSGRYPGVKMTKLGDIILEMGL